jgi:hypothetical protein
MLAAEVTVKKLSTIVDRHLAQCESALAQVQVAVAATLAARRDVTEDLRSLVVASARRDAALRMKNVESWDELSQWRDELLARVEGGPTGYIREEAAWAAMAAEAEAIRMLENLPWPR